MRSHLTTASSSTLHLLERVLRAGRPLAAEYPLVFRPGFPGRLIELAEAGETRSACAAIVRELRVGAAHTGDAGLRVGLIGSVATDPEFRGQGLATRVLDQAEAWFREQGCLFSMLWADEPDFYLRRGFEPIGAEDDYALPASLLPRLPRPSGVRLLRDTDARAVHALYTRHELRVARTCAETEALLHCPNMVALVLERAGEVVAYACRGRGEDLSDTVHEWGGETEDVLGLLRSHLEEISVSRAEAKLFLMTPPGPSELKQRLESMGVEVHEGILALGKLVDRGAAAELLRSRLGDFVERIGDDPWLITPTGSFELEDELLLALLFGPRFVHDEVNRLLELCGRRQAELPLEPFAWGLDSI